MVIPLLDAGGTRFNGLLVMAYVFGPMVTEVVVKFTTPDPELLAEKVPLKVAENELLPATGTVCVMVRVNVPDTFITPFPEKNVWKFPKLEPVGVFKLVEPRPVKVIIMALPWPPKNVTELVPLPEHPPHVKTPDVENVTGSAFALEVASATVARSRALIRFVLKMVDICFPLLESPRRSRRADSSKTTVRLVMSLNGVAAKKTDRYY